MAMTRMSNASIVTRRDTSLVTTLSQERHSLALSLAKFFVSTYVMVAHSHRYWIVDLGVTEHVTRDQVEFVKYRRILKGSRGLYMGNGASVQV